MLCIVSRGARFLCFVGTDSILNDKHVAAGPSNMGIMA